MGHPSQMCILRLMTDASLFSPQTGSWPSPQSPCLPPRYPPVVHSPPAPAPLLPVLPIYLFQDKNSPFDEALHGVYVAHARSLVDRIIRGIAGVVFGRLTASLILVPKAHEDLIQAITESQGRPFLFGEEYLHGKCLLHRPLLSR